MVIYDLRVEPGTVIGERYEIEAPAGTGGMGVVFKARDRDGSAVAIKMLRPQASELAERFIREADVLCTLNHPAIVRCLDRGSTATGWLYLVMEWLDGEDLRTRLAREPLSLVESLQLASRMAEALGVAHQRRIVHCDVKPENIFLPGGDVYAAKLLDFSIARCVDAATTLTQSGARMGTPAYMSPEQIRRVRHLNPRTDVFSLGCVLYECVTGRAAFAARDIMDLFDKILTEAPPSVRMVASSTPVRVEALLERMLAKRPTQRPSINQIIRQIDDMLTSLSVLGQQRQVPNGDAYSPIDALELRLVHVVAAPVSVWTSGVATPTTVAEELGGAAGAYQTEPTMRLGVVQCDQIDCERSVREDLGGVAEQLRAVGAQFRICGGGILAAVLDHQGAVTGMSPSRETAVGRAVEAARCALALHRARPDEVVALATGRAAVDEPRLVGEVTSRALAMLGPRDPSNRPGAQRSGVRIDALSAGLLRPRFAIVTADEGAFTLCRERQIGTSPALLDARTPFVGRKREHATLLATLEHCLDEESAQAVLVTGLPGVGKSRLGHEFLQAVEQRWGNLRVWKARGDPMYATASLHAMADAIRWSAGISGRESPAERHDKLRAGVARQMPEEHVERVTNLLDALYSSPIMDRSDAWRLAGRREVRLMRDQVRHACYELLSCEISAQPLLFIVEDLQWIDRATIDLLGMLLSTLPDRPFMVAAFGRVELHERFPNLWLGTGLTELRLGRLARHEAEALVRPMLDSPIDMGAMADLIERAEGNPLYLEELARNARPSTQSADEHTGTRDI